MIIFVYFTIEKTKKTCYTVDTGRKEGKVQWQTKKRLLKEPNDLNGVCEIKKQKRKCKTNTAV